MSMLARYICTYIPCDNDTVRARPAGVSKARPRKDSSVFMLAAALSRLLINWLIGCTMYVARNCVKMIHSNMYLGRVLFGIHCESEFGYTFLSTHADYVLD